MKHLNLLIKPASSLCNMQCLYCFYCDISSIRQTPSYGIMSENIVDKILDNIFKDIADRDEITFAFQGGEPSLAGLPWFRNFVENVNKRRGNVAVYYAFQTNGLLLDDSWCNFFHDNKFLIGLSIDAGKRFHDLNRLSSSGKGTFDVCIKAKELLDKNQVKYNILCVLTNTLAKEPEKAWRFILNENIRFIQFIPCLETPSSESSADKSGQLSESAMRQQLHGNMLRPAFFAKFYSRLLPWWINELEKNNYISIKLFDDVVNYFYKGIVSSCGINGQCHNQYVIEADGSVFPCDFFCYDEYKIGNLTENTLRELFDTEKVKQFLDEKQELPKICSTCKFLKACRGGCKRMRNIMYAGHNDPVCGYRFFLEKCLKPLEIAVKRFFQKSLKEARNYPE